MNPNDILLDLHSARRDLREASEDAKPGIALRVQQLEQQAIAAGISRDRLQQSTPASPFASIPDVTPEQLDAAIAKRYEGMTLPPIVKHDRVIGYNWTTPKEKNLPSPQEQRQHYRPSDLSTIVGRNIPLSINNQLTPDVSATGEDNRNRVFQNDWSLAHRVQQHIGSAGIGAATYGPSPLNGGRAPMYGHERISATAAPPRSPPAPRPRASSRSASWCGRPTR